MFADGAVQTNPTCRTAGDTLMNAKTRGETIVVLGRCRVEFDREDAQTFLDYGERLVVVKPDGTTLVHRDTARDPVNYHAPGGTVHARLTDDENLHLRTVKSDVPLDIEFTDIYLLASHRLQDEAELVIRGKEAHMRDYLAANPERLSDALGSPFRTLETERSMPVGDIDIFGRDEDGVAVAVELKRKTALPKAVDQLRRYVEDLSKTEDAVRGVLVAPAMSDAAADMLEERGFTFLAFGPSDLPDLTGQQMNRTLDSF
jgi:hypothetical protein